MNPESIYFLHMYIFSTKLPTFLSSYRQFNCSPFLPLLWSLFLEVSFFQQFVFCSRLSHSASQYLLSTFHVPVNAPAPSASSTVSDGEGAVHRAEPESTSGAISVLSHFLLMHLRRPSLRIIAHSGWNLDLTPGLPSGSRFWMWMLSASFL